MTAGARLVGRRPAGAHRAAAGDAAGRVVVPAVVTIVTVAKELHQTLGAARRFFAVEDEPVPVRDGPAWQSPSTGAASACASTDVTFAYGAPSGPRCATSPSRCPRARPWRWSGAPAPGKTTAAHLLLRFWDPQTGPDPDRRHDDVRELRLDDLRGLIALVAQDTYLFNTSLRENIRLGRPRRRGRRGPAAARAANVDEFVAGAAGGLRHDRRRARAAASGGQRQRVSIARALLKDAPILVLDEATSHLDAVSEAEVRQALDRLRAAAPRW